MCECAATRLSAAADISTVRLEGMGIYSPLGGKVEDARHAWRPQNIYHYIQDRMTKPDIVFDITPFYDKKLKCILAFESQFYNPNSEEPETPISSPHFLKYLEGRAIEFGRMIGVHYGEGFTVKRNIGTKNLMELI
jgi:LmbE family N-acetylglucosaminyl deacetylase